MRPHQKLTIIVTFFIFLAQSLQAQYSKVGPSLTTVATSYHAVGGEGLTPYIAFGELKFGTGSIDVLSVKKYNSSANSWDYVGSKTFTPGNVEDPKLTFDGSIPYVAFYDMTKSGDLTVMYFDGSSWINLGGQGLSQSVIIDFDIVVNAGQVTLAYKEYSKNYITAKRYSSGSWSSLPNIPGNGAAIDLEKDNLGNIHAAAISNQDTLLTLTLNGTSSWSALGTALKAGDEYTELDLMFHNNQWHLMALEEVNSRSEYIRYYTLNGSSWSKQGNDIRFPTSSSDVMLSFDGNSPMITYRTVTSPFQEIICWWYDGAKWVHPFVGGKVTSSLWNHYSVANLGSKPYLAFHNADRNQTEVYGFACSAPTINSVYALNDTVCSWGNTNVSVSGNTGGSAGWYWYDQGCQNNLRDSGLTINVSIERGSKTIYVSASGGCSSSKACDSITIYARTPNKQITVSGTDLVSQEPAADSYQWLSCDSSMNPVLGATSQTFSPGNLSNYAVEITKNGCTDTTGCASLSGLSVESLQLSKSVGFYPNPSNGVVTFSQMTTYKLFNSLGELVQEEQEVSGADFSRLGSGIYLIMFDDEMGQRLILKE